ncbi:alpha-amylase family glycosyl hydrolase [Salinibacter ruber]|uniref:alpha-amylase family glycosyl hydrolase n=1 Tax=Salinibacter ruber TaxID=146919 RepID=UPI002073E757|nr:alpha-amylase family glycosyl hydrolase [Salinibacter ruber]
MGPSTWHTTAADSLFFVLLEKAHARDLRVIIDGVFNHTGRDFFAFEDLVENQAESRYADWYAVNSFDDPATPDTSEFDYTGWWGVKSLPEFATNEASTNLQAGPKQYILDATKKWMDPDGDGDPSDGVDGWRLDVAEEVPVGFWQEWNAHVREINPEAYMVPEVWEDASGYLEETGFSATMNYHGFAFPLKGFLVDHAIEPSRFAELLRERRAAHPPRVRRGLQNLIGSHDTPRLATMVVNRADTGYAQPERFDYENGAIVDLRKNPDYKVRAPTAEERRLQRLAVLFQMTCVGAPMVYHGDEAGMWGADDPDDRKPMVWPDKDYNVEDDHPYGHDRPADPVAFNEDLFATYRDLISLRREHEALRRGSFGVVQADDARDMLTYARTHPADTVLVTLNRSDAAHSVRVSLPDSLRRPYEILRNVPKNAAARLQQNGTVLLLEVPGHTGVVDAPRSVGGQKEGVAVQHRTAWSVAAPGHALQGYKTVSKICCISARIGAGRDNVASPT